MGNEVVCRITGVPFVVSESEQEILRRLGELSRTLKEPLPLPTVHPFEFVRRRASHWNQMGLYKTKSALSGEPTLSTFPEDAELKVCTLDEMLNDEVDNTEFGRPYDFSRPFFEQWSELFRDVYHQPLWNIGNENSPYVSSTKQVKNCYLCFSALESQDSMYCHHLLSSNDCLDCIGAIRSQFCYACVDVENCYECQHCQDCRGCNNCFGCFDLRGCQDCFGCVGLQHQKFCIFNEQKSEAEYKDFIASLGLGKRDERAQALSKCERYLAQQGHVANRLIQCEDCSGDYLKNCKNSLHCYQGEDLVDCGYVFFGYSGKDCWRSSFAECELMYANDGLDSRVCIYSTGTDGGEENISCFNVLKRSSYCFGCVMLRNKSYCILNKQYSREEYFDLVPRIIAQRKKFGDWGEDFPVQYSPHYYEDSCVDDWLQPISWKTARQRGYRVKDSVTSEVSKDHSGLSPADEIPNDIESVESDYILQRTWGCSKSGKGYKLQKAELDFYKRFGVPIPTVHWRERMRQLNSKRELMPAI